MKNETGKVNEGYTIGQINRAIEKTIADLPDGWANCVVHDLIHLMLVEACSKTPDGEARYRFSPDKEIQSGADFIDEVGGVLRDVTIDADILHDNL